MRIPPLAALCILAFASPVAANPFERVAPVADPLVRKECGECHMVFQPGLLPAGSWSRIMATLSDHFGDRATLPPDQVKAIAAYLTANASGGDPMVTRITGQSWWQREHRLPAAEWSRPSVKSKSNCAACHAGAEAGLYEDD